MRPVNEHAWRIGESELGYLRECLEGGFPGSSKVHFLGRLEKAFAERFGTGYAISFCNGTATLHAALAAAGIQPGDEVIVPPLTMASTSLAVLHQGAEPVFADIDPDTFDIDPASVRERTTSRTRAVIPVALYGLSPDLDPILEWAREKNLSVIEDDAQCFLGRYRGRTVGTLGHMASFSFQNSKHMTCGEGGMVITSDRSLAEALRRFSSLGYAVVSPEAGKGKTDKRALVRPDYKRHVSVGFNYRLSEVCAAVLLAQLEKLDLFLEWRRRCAEAYDAVVRPCSWLKPQTVPTDCEHAWWSYVVALDPDRKDVAWQDFYDRFVACGGRGFYGAWALTYQEPAFRDRLHPNRDGSCPVAEALQPRLMQFKTHYGNEETIAAQAAALAETIRSFE